MARTSTQETARRALRAASALAMAAALGACEDRPDPIPEDRSWIQLEHDRIGFETVAGASEDLSRRVWVTNAGDSELAVPTLETRYIGVSDWLTVYLSAGESGYALDVYANVRENLWPGTYLATVSVDSPGAANTPATLAIELVVHPTTMQMEWTRGPAWPRAYQAWSTTVLKDGSVLAAPKFPQKTLQRWALGDPGWSLAGELQQSRTFHTATLLADGRVFFAGGREGEDAFIGSDAAARTWELYDPATWTTIRSDLLQARADHQAVLLADGRVFLVGGQLDLADPPNAELFDPGTRASSDAGIDSTGVAHQARAAIRLRDGKVLVIGNSGYERAPCVLFDPTKGTWSETGSLNLPRDLATFVLLPDGDVLAIGGYGWTGGVFSEAAKTVPTERYDPERGRWSLDAPLRVPRTRPGAAVLPSGKVLVIGGCAGEWCDATSIIEVLDPAAEDREWSFAGALGRTVVDPDVHVLEDGTVLVFGGPGWKGASLPGDDDPSARIVESWREPEPGAE